MDALMESLTLTPRLTPTRLASLDMSRTAALNAAYDRLSGNKFSSHRNARLRPRRLSPLFEEGALAAVFDPTDELPSAMRLAEEALQAARNAARAAEEQAAAAWSEAQLVIEDMMRPVTPLPMADTAKAARRKRTVRRLPRLDAATMVASAA